MNKDINKTLSALVPILRMNGENIKSIEAVQDWYHVDGREYMKEVAEITYDSGSRRYADIGADSNLTAVYDVLAVIQQIKPRSGYIERIVRNVYEDWDKAIDLAVEALKRETSDDTISRQAAIDALDCINGVEEVLRSLPSAQPEIIRCKNCKYGKDEYNDGDCYCRRPHRALVWVGNWEFYCAAAERRTDERPD